MAGPSIWWSTPHRPDRHFSSEELKRSEDHHRPLRHAALAGLVAKVGLLALAAVFASALADRVDPGGASAWAGGAIGRLSWFDAVTSGRVASSAALTVVALRLPAIAVDGWFEFRFRRGDAGYQPVSRRSFAVTTSALTLALWLITVAAAGLVHRHAGDGGPWPVTLALLVVLLAVAAVVAEHPVRRLLPDAEQPLDGDDRRHTRLRALAADFNLSGTGFHRGQAAGNGPGEQHDAPNACALGFGGSRRVVLSEGLLQADDDVRDFVVAHELTHLARRHLVAQLVAGVVAVIVTVWLVAGLAAVGGPWAWFGIAAVDPVGLPVTALVVLAVGGVTNPITAWISRAHERSADAGAIDAVGVLDIDDARDLYLAGLADLAPPSWVRLYAQHPSPGERMEYLIRHRRTVGSR